MPARELVDCIWHNGRLATLAAAPGLVMIEGGALAARGGRIVAVGSSKDMLARYGAPRCIDLEGRLVTPGLVDCHTHLVYAGHRAHEFEQRLEGRTYAQISAAGGGIRATVRATRAADEATLLRESLPRLDALLAEGVTTVEIKSGYGLETQTELRQLRVARRLGELRAVDVVTTLLAAHALPEDYAGRADDFIEQVCAELIPAAAAAGLADAIDAFCEGIAFSPAQVARVFDAARVAGLPVKLHAGQLSDLGSAALAAQHGALSADHLEYTGEDGVIAMAQSGTVAVLLPGAYYSLRETQPPPVAALRRHGVPIAIATDCNPGTSPLSSPLLAMNFAATLFGLTVNEVVAGFTREAARALGRIESIGTLEAGKFCDLAIWNADSAAELVYRIGHRPLYQRIRRGHVVTH